MSRRPKNISAVTDEILAEVASAERVKTAEIEALRATTPTHRTEMSQLLHKVAEELRTSASDVTYEDVNQLLVEIS